MIKNLFFVAALLVPGLAFAASPSTDLSIEIVPAGPLPPTGPRPPAAAVAAGFTYLLADFDFQNGQICAYDGRSPACVAATPITNWLDCTGNGSQIFHRGWGNGVSPLPCNIVMATDPLTGNQTVRIQYVGTNPGPSYAQQFHTTGSQNFTAMSTVDTTGKITFTHPSVSYYMELSYRIDQKTDPGFIGPSDWWEGSQNACDIDFEPGEIYNGTKGQGILQQYAICNGTNGYATESGTPAGFDITQYHTYAGLSTTNGSNSILRCLYLDNVLTHNAGNVGHASCGEGFHDSSQITGKPWLIDWVGSIVGASGYSDMTTTTNLYTQWVHIWTCPPANRDANNQCPGSIKTGADQSLWYWHN